MSGEELLGLHDKMRIVQELVPGKQITIAHIIANPEKVLYKKLGLDPNIDYAKSAIVTPSSPSPYTPNLKDLINLFFLKD